MGRQLDKEGRMKRYELAIEGSNICIWDWMDINDNDQWWSPRFYKMLGYEQDEIKATIDNFKALLHPEDRDQVFEAFDRHIENREPIKLEFRLETKTGDYKWVESSAKAEFDEQGKPIRMAGNIVNIDDRKQAEIELEKERRLLRTIIDNIPVSVYVKDLNGRKILANKAEYELWGFDSEEEIIGKTDADLNKEGIAALSENEDKKVLEKGEPIIEKDAYTEIDGEEYVLLVSKIPLKNKDGKTVGLVGISVDITNRKKMEDQLRQRNYQLEKLNEATNKIYSVIGHNLKTPLSSILGVSDLMLMDIEDSDFDKEVEDNLKIIRESSIKMSDLLQNLLRWARIQTCDLSINREEFSLNETVNDTIDLLSLSVEQKDLTISLVNEEPVKVYADEPLIATVIRNFLSNAIKFSEEGDTIEIDLESDDDSWQVSVSDEGIGISEEDQEKLFHDHDHLSKHGTNNEKGSGLGLQLCKELAEMHGGAITVNSTLGEGSTFTLTVPRKKS